MHVKKDCLNSVHSIDVSFKIWQSLIYPVKIKRILNNTNLTNTILMYAFEYEICRYCTTKVNFDTFHEYPGNLKSMSKLILPYIWVLKSQSLSPQLYTPFLLIPPAIVRAQKCFGNHFYTPDKCKIKEGLYKLRAHTAQIEWYKVRAYNT